jgi:hypothetical protein
MVGEASGMADEATRNSCGKVQKTEQIERVPNSIASRERFTADGLASR